MRTRQFLVIGAGRFGSALATTIYELGHEVVVIDQSEARIEMIMNSVTHAAIVDATDEAALGKLGLNNFDRVIVAIGSNLEANILATVAAKSSGASYVISKVNSKLAAQVLSRVGADEVIRPEHDMGVRLAKRLCRPSVVDAIRLGENYGVVEVEANRKLSGHLKDLRLTNRFAVQVIAVNRDGKLEVTPPADFEILPGDQVVLIGNNTAIEKFNEYLSG